jgi:hypothetical protein
MIPPNLLDVKPLGGRETLRDAPSVLIETVRQMSRIMSRWHCPSEKSVVSHGVRHI